MREIAPGIWTWRGAHPQWRPNQEVAVSYALVHDDGLALVDPLLTERSRGDVLSVLNRLAPKRGPSPHIFVTVPYHARSAPELAARWPKATVWGHPATAARFAHRRFKAIDASMRLPFGVRAVRFGSPVRRELPLYFPEHRALAVGDSIVGFRRGLRVWAQVRTTKRRTWYESRFLPTLRPLLELEPEHVLVTHGDPVVGTGTRALASALERDPIEY